jgi:preprotein translocase subunit SecA
MKTFVKISMVAGMVIILSNLSAAQGPGWRIVLNNDHSAFNISIQNNEMTFNFNPRTDTLTFSQMNQKPIKEIYTVEVTLKNNNKVIFTTTKDNMSSNKTQIILPLNVVYIAAVKQKLPSKPKYVLNIKENNNVREKLNFTFKE